MKSKKIQIIDMVATIKESRDDVRIHMSTFPLMLLINFHLLKQYYFDNFYF
jgi:hypothetical protein